MIAFDMQFDGRMGNYYTVAQCEAKVMCGMHKMQKSEAIYEYYAIILNILYRSTEVHVNYITLYNTTMNMT